MLEMSRLTGVILAGGLGSRLRACVADRPKVLAEVRGRPFLTYILDQLAQAGIRQVVLCTGYLGEKIQEKIGNNYKSMSLKYSREDEPLGTGGALKLALSLCQSDPIIALNGDSFFDVDLGGYLNWFLTTDRDAALLLTREADVGRFGQVLLGEDGRISGFAEKGAGQGPGWINAGIYLLRKKVLAAIPSGTPCSLEREVFPRLVGGSFYGCCREGKFIDIGTPESYQAAAAFFAPGARADCKQRPTRCR